MRGEIKGMKKNRLLIFDHDGTLHDSMGIFGPGMRDGFDWLLQKGYPDLRDTTDQKISTFLGMNSLDVWKDLLGDLATPELSEEVAAVVGEGIEAHLIAGDSRWFEGVDTALDALKAEGYRMVILSNCEIHLRQIYWEHFQIGRWFDKFYDCESYGFLPKTQIILQILADYPGYDAVMIGDRASDFDCAKAAGIPFVGCTYGFGTPEEVEGADAIAASPAELAETIRSLFA